MNRLARQACTLRFTSASRLTPRARQCTDACWRRQLSTASVSGCFMLKAFRRVRGYVKRDLREIINPTSLPNPPDYVKKRRLTWSERLTAFRAANKQYRDSWRKAEEPVQAPEHTGNPAEKSLGEELSETAQAAVQKGQGIRPLLHQIYESRARSYRDAVQQFVDGYREGYIGTTGPEKESLYPKTSEQPVPKPPVNGKTDSD